MKIGVKIYETPFQKIGKFSRPFRKFRRQFSSDSQFFGVKRYVSVNDRMLQGPFFDFSFNFLKQNFAFITYHFPLTLRNILFFKLRIGEKFLNLLTE